MAEHPWVLPKEIKAYSDYPTVQTRAAKKLRIDIARAEQYVISYTNNRFDDETLYPTIPESVKTAVLLVAELYAFSAAEGSSGKGAYQSETFDDYSYTAADTDSKLDNLQLGPLLDDYIVVKSKNTVTMRIRKLYYQRKIPMSFTGMLNHTCNIYHLTEHNQSLRYGLPTSPAFSYPQTPDIAGQPCHFGVKSQNVTIIQTASANIMDAKIKLTLPIGSDIRLNDKVVDCATGLEYTAEQPVNVRNHHLFAYIKRLEGQKAL